MKTGTTQHPKFRALQRLLNLKPYEAVGVLESLWMMAALFADDGDLSRFSRDEIADAIGWDNSEIDVVESLIDCRWLDLNKDVLSIHDWDEHCPKYVSDRRNKRKMRDQSESGSRKSQNVADIRRKSLPTQPNQSKPNKTKPHSDNELSIDLVIKYWNKKTSQRCRATDKRKASLSARCKDPWWRDHWRQAIDAAASSAFHMGENDRGWIADFEWFLKPDSATKLIEQKQQSQKPTSHEPARGQALLLRRPKRRVSEEGDHA